MWWTSPSDLVPSSEVQAQGNGGRMMCGGLVLVT